MKSLYVTVLRPAGYSDCTGNGLSSKVNNSTLFWDCTNEEAIDYCKSHNMDPSKQFILFKRELWGADHSYAEPLIKPENKFQTFGGNFLYTSDSRMYKTGGIYKAPIQIFDRFDSWEYMESMD